MRLVIFIILFIFSLSSHADNEVMALDCKNLKGLALRDEKFKKDGFSNARLLIVFVKNTILFNWTQKSDTPFLDIWNSSKGFKTLTTVQANSNMAVGYSVKNGLEGIRIHFKKKKAVYFKHIAPLIDGFGTDGIYKMDCIEESENLVKKLNEKNK